MVVKPSNSTNTENEHSNISVSSIKKPNLRPSSNAPSLLGIDLFAALKESKINLSKLPTMFIQSLQLDPDAAITSFIDLLIKSAGFKGQIVKTQITNDDPVTVFSEIQSSSPNLFEKEFIFQKKERRDFKTFKLKYAEFISQVVHDLNNHEETLETFKRLLGWILALSSCQYRPFRIASTVCGLAIQNNICTLIVHNYIDHESNVASISKYITILDFIFNGLYLHRYRDVDPFIRALCVKHLATWITIYPKKYLDNSYLRYIGWILSDKISEARLEAFQAIITLVDFKEKDIIFSGIRSFLDRFLPRILECATRDKDESVQNISLTLLYKLASYSLLEFEILDTLLIILLSKNQKARVMFVKILNEYLTRTQSSSLSSIFAKEYGRLSDLAEWLIQKIDDDFFRNEKSPCSSLITNLISSYVQAEMLQEIDFKNIISFLSTNFSVATNSADLDKVRIVFLYFLKGIRQAIKKKSGEFDSIFVLNWNPIHSNITSSSYFKANLFTILSEVICDATSTPFDKEDSKDWLLAISEIFSDTQRSFLETQAPSIQKASKYFTSYAHLMISAFGVDNFLVEKRNILINTYSFLEEELINYSSKEKDNYILDTNANALCSIIIRLQCLYDGLFSFNSSLLEEFKSTVIKHYELLANEFSKILVLLTNAMHLTDSLLYLYIHLSTYLFSILKLLPITDEQSLLIMSIIDSASNYGIIQNSKVFSNSLFVYSEVLLFSLRNNILSIKEINTAPLDCIANIIESDLKSFSKNTSELSRSPVSFQSFTSSIASDLLIINCDEYSNIRCYLRLLLLKIVETNIINIFITLVGTLPIPIVLLFQHFFDTVSKNCLDISVIHSLAGGLFNSCIENTKSVELIDKSNEFLCKLLLPVSSKKAIASVSELVDNFLEALIKQVVESNEGNVNYYLFKLINEHWTKYLTSKQSYCLFQKLENHLPERSTTFLDHYIQFKKFLTRSSSTLIHPQINDTTTKRIHTDITKIMTEAKKSETDIDATCLAHVQSEIDPVPMNICRDDSFTSTAEAIPEFPTSPILE